MADLEWLERIQRKANLFQYPTIVQNRIVSKFILFEIVPVKIHWEKEAPLSGRKNWALMMPG